MTDGITLHVVEAGPRDGRPIFLLHGFPEFWWGWRHQVEPIARAGYRVIVPDQRGYNLSEKPEGVDAYSLDRLSGDILRRADNRGLPTFAVAGHDWGGMVAWWLAGTRADRVSRLIAINAPHPAIVRAYALRHPGQLFRSAYAAFFQLPWLPEAVLRAADFRLMKRSMRDTSRPGTFCEADLDRYREAWSEPGALTAMLNWYRALRRSPVAAQRVNVPALVIWGIRDRFLQRGLADASLALCDRGRIIQVDASHWVQHEEPARVNEAILEFLAQ